MSGSIEMSGEDYHALLGERDRLVAKVERLENTNCVLRGENVTLRRAAEQIAVLVDCPDPICLTALAENDEETAADLLVKAVKRHCDRIAEELAAERERAQHLDDMRQVLERDKGILAAELAKTRTGYEANLVMLSVSHGALYRAEAVIAGLRTAAIRNGWVEVSRKLDELHREVGRG